MNTSRKPAKTKRSPPKTSSPRRQRGPLTPVQQLLWAGIGLVLTIGGTLMEPATTTMPWFWGDRGIEYQPLGVTLQVGAVLLVGCLGGPLAAIGSQVAYLTLGLLGLPIFTHGGGLSYLQRPTFGYLLGFLPGAWLCAQLAFRRSPQLESLMVSCLSGLVVIHTVGIVYQIGLLLTPFGQGLIALGRNIFDYSIYPLPGQFALLCAIALLSFILRRIMFY